MDKVVIEVPSSSANVGLGYDVWCVGLEQPNLKLTYTSLPNFEITVESTSPFKAPDGRHLGYAGKAALEKFLRDNLRTEGAHLYYEDNGYPVGGLGRSGAETVGAIMAAAVIYGISMSRDQIIRASARGEPGEHKDNVAASTNGRFNIIFTSPHTNTPSIDCYDVPANLGLAIGISSYQKTGGTEAGRMILRSPVES